MRRRFTVVALALLLAGCAAAPKDTSIRSRALPGDAAALARFELPAGPFPCARAPDSPNPDERAFTLTFPSAISGDPPENNTVTCRVWMPKSDAPTPRPGVILLHYLRGTFKPMEEAGRYFAS